MTSDVFCLTNIELRIGAGTHWQHKEGRNRHGDKICTDLLVH